MIILLLVLFLVFGGVGYGYRGTYGAYSFSPALVILVIILALYLSDTHFHNGWLW